MEVGSFRGNCKDVASDVIGFWPISIKRITDLQVKHLAFLCYCWMGWNRVNS